MNNVIGNNMVSCAYFGDDMGTTVNLNGGDSWSATAYDTYNIGGVLLPEFIADKVLEAICDRIGVLVGQLTKLQAINEMIDTVHALEEYESLYESIEYESDEYEIDSRVANCLKYLIWLKNALEYELARDYQISAWKLRLLKIRMEDGVHLPCSDLVNSEVEWLARELAEEIC